MLAWKLKITTHEPSVPAAFLEIWTAVHEITDLFIFSFSEKLFYRFFFSKQRINVVLREADWERSVLLLSSQLRNRLFHALVVIPMAECLLFNDFIVTDVEQFVISFCRQPNRAYRTQHKYSFALEKLKESLKVVVYSHKLYCAKEFPHALALFLTAKPKASWHSTGLGWGPLPTDRLHVVTLAWVLWQLSLREWSWTHLTHLKLLDLSRREHRKREDKDKLALQTLQGLQGKNKTTHGAAQRFWLVLTQRWQTTTGLLLISTTCSQKKATLFKWSSLLCPAIVWHAVCLRWAVQTPNLITEHLQLEGTHRDHRVQLLASHRSTPKSDSIQCLKIFILTDPKAEWKTFMVWFLVIFPFMHCHNTTLFGGGNMHNAILPFSSLQHSTTISTTVSFKAMQTDLWDNKNTQKKFCEGYRRWYQQCLRSAHSRALDVRQKQTLDLCLGHLPVYWEDKCL